MAKVKRERITARMKVNCLLDRVHKQFGEYLKCAISGEDMKPGDAIQFDHTHALVHRGPHDWRALRPVQPDPHKHKSKRDVRDAAHVRRLKKPHKKRGRKIPASSFPDKQAPLPSSKFARRG